MKSLVFLASIPEGEDVEHWIRAVVDRGAFASRVPANWRALYPALADFASIAAGDLAFFFAQRRLYGMFRVVGAPGSTMATFLNHTGALDCKAVTFDSSEGGQLIGEGGPVSSERLIVGLRPDPSFFTEGIDMDELLSDPESTAANGLRTLSGKSFFVLGDQETRWLERRFLAHAAQTAEKQYKPKLAGKVLKMIEADGVKRFSPASLVTENPKFVKNGGVIQIEAAVHALVIEQLYAQKIPLFRPPPTHVILDVHHEHAASPVKPAKYQDRVDVLAIAGSDSLRQLGRGIPSFFDIYEIKTGSLGSLQAQQTVTQVMKYVDFIAQSMCGGNYQPIRANLVARDFEADFTEDVRDLIERRYITAARSGLGNARWVNFRLVTYAWDKKPTFAIEKDAGKW